MLMYFERGNNAFYSSVYPFRCAKVNMLLFCHHGRPLAGGSPRVCKNSQVYPQGKLYPRKEKEEKEGERRKKKEKGAK